MIRRLAVRYLAVSFRATSVFLLAALPVLEFHGWLALPECANVQETCGVTFQ